MSPRPPRSAADLTRLVASQTIYYGAVSVDLTLTSLAGLRLAPTPLLATLPLTLITGFGLLASVAAGLLTARYGYRAVMAMGGGCAVVGGLLSMIAVYADAFWLLCLATSLLGAYRSTGGYIRYLAADLAPDRLGIRDRDRSMAGSNTLSSDFLLDPGSLLASVRQVRRGLPSCRRPHARRIPRNRARGQESDCICRRDCHDLHSPHSYCGNELDLCNGGCSRWSMVRMGSSSTPGRCPSSGSRRATNADVCGIECVSCIVVRRSGHRYTCEILTQLKTLSHRCSRASAPNIQRARNLGGVDRISDVACSGYAAPEPDTPSTQVRGSLTTITDSGWNS
ncbi:hypothetical protein SANTM175S_09359 [Streptomyces antimycoticus]